MQVAHESEVINMLDGKELDQIVKKHNPDYIVPEVESIRTERLYDYEAQGYSVIPSAQAANFTMNRKYIRDLAAKDLNIKTAKYKYAKSHEELEKAVKEIGIPCIVKPLMSSSGKGQSTVKSVDDIKHSWNNAIYGSRGDVVEVIVEEYINFDYEITLLTLTQKTHETLFCSPIGHRQERGDFQESWQPMNMDESLVIKAQKMSQKITSELKGNGIWGVEFFIKDKEIFFSELSPRPHDTGMVTLAGTQMFSQFELHARAILGIPVTEIKLLKNGASAVILANEKNNSYPLIHGLEKSGVFATAEVRIFGKPSSKKYRRMGVALAAGKESVKELVQLAKKAANCIKIN